MHADSADPIRRSARIVRTLSFRRFSALYILVILVGIFSVTVPETFLTTGTWRSILDTHALTALAAVALTIPTAAGLFNLAIGAEIGFASMFMAWLLVEQGMGVGAAFVSTLLLGVLIGLVSATLVSVLGLDSFITTLALSSVGAALTFGLSGGTQILGLPESFSSFSTNRVAGLTYPFVVMIVIAGVAWYVLEFTPLGRRIYATGGNAEAARLAGVRTGRVVVISLVSCAVISAVVGVMLASRLGTGDPTAGPSFLLPAFSAVFLGATQFKAGRFNIWGTVVAVYVLAIGVKGLQLSGAPVWIPDLFNGLALLVAVAMAHPEKLLDLIRRSRRAIRPDRGVVLEPGSA